jgi:hypothetical protein
MLAVMLVGCSGGFGPGGPIRVTSITDDPVTLTGDFDTVYYRHEENGGTTFIVSDIPLDKLRRGRFDEGQVLHLELLWVPKPGSTPIDRTATNVSIRHVVFVDGEVGIYGGAGFAMPRGSLGARRVSLSVHEASMSLIEATGGFVDSLGPANLAGAITARHDARLTRQLHFNVSQRVTDAIGETRFVFDLGLDLFDLDPEVPLAVSELAAVALATLEVEDLDLRTLDLADDLRGDGRALHVGPADR